MTEGTAAQTKKMLEEQVAAMTAQKAKTTKATKATTQQEVAQDERFASIDNNTFAKIMFDDKLSPEQKKEAVVKAQQYDMTQTKAQNELRLKEFDLFKEYLQNMRKEMAQEIIRLTDTEAFSELKDVYEQINDAVLEFDNSMKPLTDIIDAVYNLRLKGSDVTLGIFKEIQNDKAKEEERAKKLEEQTARLGALDGQIGTINRDIAVLGEQKAFFGLGGIKRSAREQIALKQLELQNINTQLGAATAEIDALKNASNTESQFGDLAHEKEKLRELLDISSAAHKERQKRLVDAAQNFVTTTETRVGGVLGHFGQMEGQINSLFEANNGLQSMYGIISAATKEASKENQRSRDSLSEPQGEENEIGKMARESKKLAVEDYITTLDRSTVDTGKTFADLTAQSYRIKNMKDANREQVYKTRELHSSGVAGIADRLSTVLQIVSGAALGEASEMAGQTIHALGQKTSDFALKDSFSTVTNIKGVNSSLETAIESLQAYRDTARVVTQASRESLEAVKVNQDILQGLIRETQDAVKDSFAVNAEVDMQGGASPVPAKGGAAVPKPGKPTDTLAKLRGLNS